VAPPANEADELTRLCLVPGFGRRSQAVRAVLFTRRQITSFRCASARARCPARSILATRNRLRFLLLGFLDFLFVTVVAFGHGVFAVLVGLLASS